MVSLFRRIGSGSDANPIGIEMAGTEPIPGDRRHGRPRTLFTLWFGANIQFATLSVGALSTSVFGLDLIPAACAIALGTLFSATLVGLFSTRGARIGIGQLIQSRGPFGWFGNLPSAIFTVLNGVGWCVVDSLLGIFILRSLLDIGFTTAVAIVAGAQLIVPLIGYRLIHSMEKFLSGVLVIAFAVVSVLAFGKMGSSAAVDSTPGGLTAFVLTLSVTSARALGWSAYSSDYSRYLPADTPPARTFLAAAGGSAVAGIWIGVLGAALGTVGKITEPTSLISHLVPGMTAKLILVTLLASTLASTVLDLYSGSMAALVAGVRVPRWLSVIGVCGVSTVLTLWVGEHGFAGHFQDFLLLTSYWVAPWAAVNLVAFWWRERGRNPRIGELYDTGHRFGWGLPATLVGVIASVPFMTQSLYTGPVAAKFPALGACGQLIGFTAAGLTYLGLTARKAAPAPMLAVDAE
ncbi:hypothetical protein GPX89_15215 [Nocardia sp. ET3-3]|uniref:Cytosine permease n=1 Tax=Nocardia terrae TaxID=2675851 RepID=A0A7K1UWC6_9NOCA|nr:cytosine permease [Nocardia terrae]MVU78592.1 hypothetical protein [Nocardia terrae]